MSNVWNKIEIIRERTGEIRHRMELADMEPMEALSREYNRKFLLNARMDIEYLLELVEELIVEVGYWMNEEGT